MNASKGDEMSEQAVTETQESPIAYEPKNLTISVNVSDLERSIT
jgi:hypothetical protein